MVHITNGRNYSVQPNGSRQVRGKTGDRTGRPSSRKTHLEDSRVTPHSPRPVPTTFEINSEPELIQSDVLKVEKLLSGSNRNISVPAQKLVHSSQRGKVVNMPTPLEGGHKLLLIDQELSGSGEDHKNIGRLESIMLQIKGQKYK
ncbi:hypothetical protein O181_103375 [Austropuccinia psidii MF-1]|uniref:Uncharacterized protein n=1 Tax=Austropuccinia psidii MF-1 TaxID=1389203 RepID=A0A9Q3PJQ7_9BASI|nr:hypothetical protein [Austropuccinia psidii MF-1]